MAGIFYIAMIEFEIMKADIEMCKQLGCDGVVFGILTADGNVDKRRCNELIAYAYPLGVTFHRAFDRAAKPFEALEEIIDLGFERVLSSGLVPKAIDGKETLAALIKQSADRIIIMPGSGVNAGNIISIAESTGAKEFHSSASMFINSNMKYENTLMNEEMKHVIVNEDEVKKMVSLLANFENLVKNLSITE